MTTDRAAAYRALLSQALIDGDFYALRGKQGDKAIANRFYNLLPLIAELREADRGAKGTVMNDKAAAVVSEEMVMRACVRYMEAFHVSGPITSDDVYAMRAALQAALGVGGWRPIAEAPKDGTYVLITDRRHPTCHLIARWNHGKWWGHPTQTGRSITWDEATDFMLLPPPPASEEG